MIVRRHLAPQNLLRRVRIVLEASQGRSNTAIAVGTAWVHEINRDTASAWRRRYAEAQPNLEEAPSEKLGEVIEPMEPGKPERQEFEYTRHAARVVCLRVWRWRQVRF